MTLDQDGFTPNSRTQCIFQSPMLATEKLFLYGLKIRMCCSNSQR